VQHGCSSWSNIPKWKCDLGVLGEQTFLTMAADMPQQQAICSSVAAVPDMPVCSFWAMMCGFFDVGIPTYVPHRHAEFLFVRIIN